MSDILFKNIPKLILALVVLWVGWKLIKFFGKFLKRSFERRQVDASLQTFLLQIIAITLKVLLILTVMMMVGIQVTSFIAMLGAAGLAVGMALQGTLQNFAGGIIILLLKPYKVGDFIEQGSYSGIVRNIQIFNTVLTTLDNKTVIIPNTQLATNTLINYTKMDVRRADIQIGICYGESIERARTVMLEVAKAQPLMISEPEEPAVVVLDLGESSVNLELRVWVKSPDYHALKSELNQAVYEKFREIGIEIPFNQLQVHISKD